MAKRLTKRQATQAVDAIQTGRIIQEMQRAFDGKREMTQIQFQIGKTLLAKTLPDQRAIDHQVDGDLTINLVSYGTGHDPK